MLLHAPKEVEKNQLKAEKNQPLASSDLSAQRSGRERGEGERNNSVEIYRDTFGAPLSQREINKPHMQLNASALPQGWR